MKISSYYASELDSGGYGHVGMQFRTHFARMGMQMLPPDQFGWDKMIAYTAPRATILGPHKRDDVILHTMFEAVPVPSTWIDVCNRVGTVWVPSEWCARLFRNQGVTTPIFVSGYGYDPEFFVPIDRRGRNTPLKVLVWGDLMVSRKWVLKAVSVFTKADIPGATLDVKINDPMIKREISAVNDEGVVDNRVTIINGPLERRALIEWLNSGDVLVYISGGEGYGLIPLEAMATGMPIIAMRETGLQEYMREDAILSVPSVGIVPAPSLTTIHKTPTFVHDPDVGVAVEHLRWVADHRNAAAELGLYGYETIRHLTWQRAARAALDHITVGGVS